MAGRVNVKGSRIKGQGSRLKMKKRSLAGNLHLFERSLPAAGNMNRFYSFLLTWRGNFSMNNQFGKSIIFQ